MEPGHLTPADVFGFIEDDLDPVWLELVWEHLDRCEECVRVVSKNWNEWQKRPAAPAPRNRKVDSSERLLGARN